MTATALRLGVLIVLDHSISYDSISGFASSCSHIARARPAPARGRRLELEVDDPADPRSSTAKPSCLSEPAPPRPGVEDARLRPTSTVALTEHDLGSSR
jgi:hypothetical protein